MSATLKILWLCLLLIVGLILTASYISNRESLTSGDQEVLNAISPDGSFSVDVRRTLKINPNRPNIVAAVTKDKNLFLDQIILYPEGAFDTDFELQYPDHKWENNQTLRLGPKGFFDLPSDELILVNKSTKAAKYIRVNSTEIYLVFDVKPNETIRFPIYWPEVEGAKSKGLAARGMLEDGTVLPWLEKGFPFHKGAYSRFCLEINNETLNAYECS